VPWRQPRTVGIEGEGPRFRPRVRGKQAGSDRTTCAVTGRSERSAVHLGIEQEPSELPLFRRRRLSTGKLPWEVPLALDEFSLPVYVRIDQPQTKIKAWRVLRPQVAPKRIAARLGFESRNEQNHNQRETAIFGSVRMSVSST
jgi:hypothetical protein